MGWFPKEMEVVVLLILRFAISLRIAPISWVILEWSEWQEWQQQQQQDEKEGGRMGNTHEVRRWVWERDGVGVRQMREWGW